jgi:hypothetical protein
MKRYNHVVLCMIFVLMLIGLFSKLLYALEYSAPCMFKVTSGMINLPADVYAVEFKYPSAGDKSRHKISQNLSRLISAFIHQGSQPSVTPAELKQFSIDNPAFIAFLRKWNITWLSQVFPEATPSDKISLDVQGKIVKVEDLSTVYLINVPVKYDLQAVAEELRKIKGIEWVKDKEIVMQE